MALTVKPIQQSAEKLVRNAQAAATEYGVAAQAAGEKWSAGAQAAASNFQQAVTAAGIKDRFARGVARAGAAKYSRKIKEVGADRFSTGVAAGKSDYAANAEPYFTMLAGLTLSPRQPRGSDANINRVREVAKAQPAKRLALLGAGGGTE